MFISEEAHFAAHVLKGMGVSVALPLLDAMVPARRLGATGQPKVCAWRPSRWCTARPAHRVTARRTCGRRRRSAATST
jgi:hypothetical protein